MALSSWPLILARAHASANILGILTVGNVFPTVRLATGTSMESWVREFVPLACSVRELPRAAQTAIKRPRLSLTFDPYCVTSAK